MPLLIPAMTDDCAAHLPVVPTFKNATKGYVWITNSVGLGLLDRVMPSRLVIENPARRFGLSGGFFVKTGKVTLTGESLSQIEKEIGKYFSDVNFKTT
jgi:hypothetical protein